MPLFRTRSPVSIPADRFRTRLRLEQLEWRDQPSALVDGGAAELVFALGDGRFGGNTAPVIEDFTAEEAGNGLFLFTGRVTDEAPAGLTVTFGGVQSVAGLTAVTDENGNFSLLVRLNTDGTDNGIVSAMTADAQGAASNEALVHVSPTPP